MKYVEVDSNVGGNLIRPAAVHGGGRVTPMNEACLYLSHDRQTNRAVNTRNCNSSSGI